MKASQLLCEERSCIQHDHAHATATTTAAALLATRTMSCSYCVHQLRPRWTCTHAVLSFLPLAFSSVLSRMVWLSSSLSEGSAQWRQCGWRARPAWSGRASCRTCGCAQCRRPACAATPHHCAQTDRQGGTGNVTRQTTLLASTSRVQRTWRKQARQGKSRCCGLAGTP